MKILLTNDDGIEAPGLHALKNALVKLGDVTVVAPEEQRSAISHAITLFDPLIVQHKVSTNGAPIYAVRGTPADSVKLALTQILAEQPDVVVSGINFGLNSGSNILYSGTVAAALEASQFHITAVAVSIAISKKPDFKSAARIARHLIARISKRYPKTDLTFNINIPACKPSKIKGVEITRQERQPYEDHFERREDPRGRTYFWIKGAPEVDYVPTVADGMGPVPTDAWALSHNYVSITPLRRDLTSYRALNDLKKLPKQMKKLL